MRPSDEPRQSRIAALTAVTYLYLSGGYVTTIGTVNAFLTTGAIPSKNLRFYRVCAFAQLFRAYRDAGRLSPDDDAQITARVASDTAITAAFGPAYRKQIVDRANPSPGSAGDDLQAFTATHPRYARELLGLSNLRAAERAGDPNCQ